MLTQEEEAERQRGKADGDIDVEGPAPREPLDQEAAQDRPRGGAEDEREHEDARYPHSLLRREGAVEHGHPDGSEQPTACPLEDPKGDQLVQTLGEAAECGGPGEDRERDEEDALGAEPVAQPAGGGDEGSQADEVADHYRLD